MLSRMSWSIRSCFLRESRRSSSRSLWVAWSSFVLSMRHLSCHQVMRCRRYNQQLSEVQRRSWRSPPGLEHAYFFIHPYVEFDPLTGCASARRRQQSLRFRGLTLFGFDDMTASLRVRKTGVPPMMNLDWRFWLLGVNDRAIFAQVGRYCDKFLLSTCRTLQADGSRRSEMTDKEVSCLLADFQQR